MDYYYYLSLSGSYKVDDIDDRREFQETLVRAGSGPRGRGSALAGPGVDRAGTVRSEDRPLEDHRMSCKGGRSESSSPPPPRRCSHR